MALKIPEYLNQYLITNKKCSIHQLGTFTFELSPDYNPANDKKKQVEIGTVHFEFDPKVKTDEGFIDFIVSHSRKIRPLAISDMESFISLGMEFLNTGKPFPLEGLGTLNREKGGTLSFKPVDHFVASEESEILDFKETHVEDSISISFKEGKYNTANKGGRIFSKILVGIGAIITLGIVIWGGYYLYTQTKEKGSEGMQIISDTLNVKDEPSTIILDSLGNTQQPLQDTVINIPGTYKMVFEITDSKERALYRYNQLKSFGVDVQMETSDSTRFKMFVLIKSLPEELDKKKDSLTAYFGRQVIVE